MLTSVPAAVPGIRVCTWISCRAPQPNAPLDARCRQNDPEDRLVTTIAVTIIGGAKLISGSAESGVRTEQQVRQSGSAMVTATTSNRDRSFISPIGAIFVSAHAQWLDHCRLPAVDAVEDIG